MAALSGNLSYRNRGEPGEVVFSRLVSKLLNFNGTVGWGDLQVTAQATPNATVAVAPGDCVIGSLSPSVSTYSYHGFLPAPGNLTVTNNTSGSPRIDSVVAYVDLSVVSSASSENPGAFKVNVVAGTPAGSPSAPSPAAIAASIGASNPYIVLANIAVANSFSVISSGNITDLRVPAGSHQLCKVTGLGNQSAANATDTIISWDSSVYDPWGMHSTSVNVTRIVVPFTGIAHVQAMVRFAVNGTGIRAVAVKKNGSFLPFDVSFNANPTRESVAYFDDKVVVAANDYLEVNVWQNSGGALNADAASSFFSVQQLY